MDIIKQLNETRRTLRSQARKLTRIAEKAGDQGENVSVINHIQKLSRECGDIANDIGDNIDILRNVQEGKGPCAAR